LPALEHHTYSEDNVEEGGIKIKKIIFVHENGNFFRVVRGKRKKIKFYLIPNHHFWMSEGSRGYKKIFTFCKDVNHAIPS
jgi:hypothetical protein